jgi:hypothetical protein
MSARILGCFKCGKELESAFPPEHTDDNQPYAGTTFVSHGHYGSTAFDAMDGSFLELNICDDCLRANRDQVLVGRVTEHREFTYSDWTEVSQ